MNRAIMVFAACAVVATAGAAWAESKGEQIFKQKCAMCHVVKGQGGKIGPELTKIAAKLKEKDIKVQLEDPKKNNPKTSMPSFKTLPKGDFDALLGYLKTLK